MRLPKDVSEFLRKFTTVGIKSGDLVITAEIHRVVDRHWGNKNNSGGYISAVTLWPKCWACRKRKECVHQRVMQAKAGQQGVMKLK